MYLGHDIYLLLFGDHHRPSLSPVEAIVADKAMHFRQRRIIQIGEDPILFEFISISGIFKSCSLAIQEELHESPRTQRGDGIDVVRCTQR